MITNKNYIPPNTDTFYPNYLHQADHTPEAYCPKCDSYTQKIRDGCCGDCGSEVKESP